MSRLPIRPPALHVQAALGRTLQLSPDRARPGASSRPAPHVWAAVGPPKMPSRGGQAAEPVTARPDAGGALACPPAPHVQAALGRALQQMPNRDPRAAVESPASHVRAAVAQPRMPAGASERGAPGSQARRSARVLQLSEKSLKNVAHYSSYVQHYGLETVRRVLQENRLEVRGHASGKPGDGMNDATRQDLKALGDALKKDVKTKGGGDDEREVRGKMKLTKFESVASETEKLYEKHGNGAFNDIMEYLESKLKRNEISGEEFGILSERYTGLCLELS